MVITSPLPKPFPAPESIPIKSRLKKLFVRGSKAVPVDIIKIDNTPAQRLPFRSIINPVNGNIVISTSPDALIASPTSDTERPIDSPQSGVSSCLAARRSDSKTIAGPMRNRIFQF